MSEDKKTIDDEIREVVKDHVNGVLNEISDNSTLLNFLKSFNPNFTEPGRTITREELESNKTDDSENKEPSETPPEK